MSIINETHNHPPKHLNESLEMLLAFMRRRLFGLAAEEIRFVRRGFRGATRDMQSRVEEVGAAFLSGYHSALDFGQPELLSASLNRVEAELRGFAFEGAAMGLALLDSLSPWRATRVNRFLSGAGKPHRYMIHVGIGWLGARLPIGFKWQLARLDPLLRWLAFDGWGFHEGFFHWPDYIAGQPPPKKLMGYERRAFDQGLGRSFWFVNGGNVDLIGRTISDFPHGRQFDLWSGIGLAATYAGIASEDSLQRLGELACQFRPHLAQGAAFAAKARQYAGNSNDYVRLAAKVLCDMTAEDAARLTDLSLENLRADAQEPAYEIWRRRIQNHFAPTPQLH